MKKVWQQEPECKSGKIINLQSPPTVIIFPSKLNHIFKQCHQPGIKFSIPELLGNSLLLQTTTTDSCWAMGVPLGTVLTIDWWGKGSTLWWPHSLVHLFWQHRGGESQLRASGHTRIRTFVLSLVLALWWYLKFLLWLPYNNVIWSRIVKQINTFFHKLCSASSLSQQPNWNQSMSLVLFSLSHLHFFLLKQGHCHYEDRDTLLSQRSSNYIQIFQDF